MIKVFLSASIPLPLPERNPEKYFSNADVVAIRDAVKALVFEVTQVGTIIFGGHPAITPLVAQLMRGQSPETRRRVILYQSRYFEEDFIPQNDEFVKLKLIPRKGVGKSSEARRESLAKMRRRMIEDTRFDAGVFIGGMDGVEDEFKAFHDFHKQAQIWPIASTGAAARIIFERIGAPRPDLFLDQYTYPVLFRTLLKELM